MTSLAGICCYEIRWQRWPGINQIKQTRDAKAVSNEGEATTMYEAQEREPDHY